MRGNNDKIMNSPEDPSKYQWTRYKLKGGSDHLFPSPQGLDKNLLRKFKTQFYLSDNPMTLKLGQGL